MIDAQNADPFGFAPTAREALESLASGRAALDEAGAARSEADRAALEAEAAQIREDAAGLSVRVLAPPARGLIRLQARLQDPVLAAELAEALRVLGALGPGEDLPGPLERRLRGERGVFWLAPDALWIAAPHAEAEGARDALDAALAGRSRLVAEVSDAWARFQLVGEGARAVLAKGAAIDFAPTAFGLFEEEEGLGDFRRLRFAGSAAALHQLESAPERFEIFCRRSEAEGLWLWLRRAARAGATPEIWPENWPSRDEDEA